MICVLLSALLVVCPLVRAELRGCADGSMEGLESKVGITACKGAWEGHVQNSGHLCAIGWKVCGWDDAKLLGTLKWDESISIEGCFAYNAAQEGGMCEPCSDDPKQDDLGAIGGSCPFAHEKLPSCISKGRIDAGHNSTCSYQEGITTGVLCCKLPERAPVIHTSLPGKMKVPIKDNLTIHCHTSGSPPPIVRWMHNGMFVDEEPPRIIIAKTGALYVSDVSESDGGIYTCAAINPAGEALESTLVKVTGGTGILDRKKELAENGCADGSVEGLRDFQDIAACEGAWKGHIRKGKTLCAEGWRVCNHEDTPLLMRISWEVANGINGCFAYNAANNFGKCTSCSEERHHNNMGGVGRHCSQRRRSRTSCLAEGRIDVYYGRKKSGVPSCYYQPGLVSGVMCCKIVSEIRPKEKETDKNDNVIIRETGFFRLHGEPYCENPCQNGGICVGFNRCRCNNDWKGALCQIPVCRPACKAGSECVSPGTCSCSKLSDEECGFGPSIKDGRIRGTMLKEKSCRRMCLHGGRCEHGSCFCPAHTRGRYCQEALVPGVPYDPPKRYNKHNKHRPR